MPRSALAGTRIRERRLALGLKQADLARSIGVSPSYLNLIEHNRRRVGEALTGALAKALGVAVTALAEGAENALFEGLREAAAAAPAAGAAPEADRAEEFVGRFPGWAGLLAQRQGRLATLERQVEALSERLVHDPHLSASLHEVLSAAASVRSTAAILAETDDIDPAWRRRFHANLHGDSERLSQAAEALVAYLDGATAGEAALASPQEEVEAWLSREGWHLAATERPQMPPPEALIAGAPELATTAARRMALDHIARARADAQALPLEPFLAALAAEGPDPGLLAQRLGVALPAVFRRLATLPAAPAGPAPGLLIADGSGTLTFRRPLAGFPVPRFGAGCPLWPLYTALAHPLTAIRQRLRLAGRPTAGFLAYAYCQPEHPQGFGGPQILTAHMLILPETAAAPPDNALEVGSSCRVCLRQACPARREPSFLTP